jgi:ribosomal-protein-alanine N-acetyltransferase
VQLRYYRSTDLNNVYDLARRSLREKYNPSIFIELPPYWPQGFIVLEEMDRTVGFIFGIMISQIEARVLMLAISPERRNQGLGTLLCQQFFQECGKKGARLISLEVRESNMGALKFYQRMGFSLSDRMEHYYSDGEDGLQLQFFL